MRLAPKEDDPYRVINVHGQTIMIDNKGLHNTVSIYRVVLASEAQRTSKATTQARILAKIEDQLSNEGKKS